jgi:hypothetical protein
MRLFLLSLFLVVSWAMEANVKRSSERGEIDLSTPFPVFRPHVPLVTLTLHMSASQLSFFLSSGDTNKVEGDIRAVVEEGGDVLDSAAEARVVDDEPVSVSLRGAGSASATRCPQRGFSVKVDDGEGKLRVGRVNGRSLKLISGCFDLTGAELLSSTSAYTYFGLWQSNVAQAEVLLRANGVSHSQGIYRIVESVPGVLNDAEGNTFVVRRNSDESVSIEEPDEVNTTAMANAIRAPYETLISYPTDSPTLLADVEARLDLDQYLWFVAANTRVMLGDYIDETFFYDVTNPTQPSVPYMRVHSWDMDDIWTECHNPDGPFATYPLLFCGETVIEEYIRANDGIRSRYEEILRSTMNLLPPELYVQHFNAVLDDVARRLTAAGTRAAEVQFNRGTQRHSTAAEAIAYAADKARDIFDTQTSWYYDLAANLPVSAVAGFTITKASSPYLVAAADWVVGAGNTVTVEAGVNIILDTGRSIRVADGASLVLAGTAAEPIYVYGAAGSFGGIEVGAGASLTLSQVRVRGAQTGIVATGAASVRLDRCRVDDAGGTAVQLDAATVSLDDVEVGLSPSNPDVVGSLADTTASLFVDGPTLNTLTVTRFTSPYPLSIGTGLASASLHQIVLPADAPTTTVTFSSTATASVILGFDIVASGADTRVSLRNSDVTNVAAEGGAAVAIVHSVVRGTLPPTAGVANSILASAAGAGAAFDVGNVLLASVSLMGSCPSTDGAHAALAAAYSPALPAAATAFFPDGPAPDGDARGTTPHLLAGPVGGPAPGGGVCHSCVLRRPSLPHCTSDHQCTPSPLLASLPASATPASTAGPPSSYLPYLLVDSFAAGTGTVSVVDDDTFPWPPHWLDGTSRRSIAVNKAVVRPSVELLLALPSTSTDAPLLSSFSSSSLATFTVSLVRHADAVAEELVARFVRDLNDGAGRASLAEVLVGGEHRGVGLVRATPLAEAGGTDHGDRLHVRVAADAASLTMVQRSLTASAPFALGDSGAVASATIDRLDAAPLTSLGDAWRLLRLRSLARLAASLHLLHATCTASSGLVLESVLEDGVLSVAGVVPGGAGSSLFAASPDLTGCPGPDHPLRWLQRLLTNLPDFQTEVHLAFDEAADTEWSHASLLAQAAAVDQDLAASRSTHAASLVGSSWPACSTDSVTGTVLAQQRASVSTDVAFTLAGTADDLLPASVAPSAGLVVGTRWLSLSQLSAGRTLRALRNLPLTAHAIAPAGWQATVGAEGGSTLTTTVGNDGQVHQVSVQASTDTTVEAGVACAGLRFSELSPRSTGVDVPEWFELANDGPTARSLAGLAVVGDVAFAFDSSATIGPRERLVIASSAPAFRRSFGFLPYGVFAGKLTVGSGDRVLVLVDQAAGRSIASAAWSRGTVDKARTMVPARVAVDAGACHVRAWRASSATGGSPGVATLLLPLTAPSALLPTSTAVPTYAATVNVSEGWTILSARVLVHTNEGTTVSSVSLSTLAAPPALARLPLPAAADVDADDQGTIGLFGPDRQDAVIFGDAAAQAVGQGVAARLAVGTASPGEGLVTVSLVPSSSPNPFVLDLAVELELLPTAAPYPPTHTSLPGWPTFTAADGPAGSSGDDEAGGNEEGGVDGGLIAGLVVAALVACSLVAGCLFIRRRNGERYSQSTRDARLSPVTSTSRHAVGRSHSGRASRRSSYVTSMGPGGGRGPPVPPGPYSGPTMPSSTNSVSAGGSTRAPPPPPPAARPPPNAMQVPAAHPYAMTADSWSAVPQQATTGGSLYTQQPASHYNPSGGGSMRNPHPPPPPNRGVGYHL